MNYKFSNLLASPYRGGSLLLAGDELLSPVGNRVSQIDLKQSSTSTLPFENTHQVQTLAVSPDGRLLLSIDVGGRALIINRHRRVLLHHFSFKDSVRAAAWSPDGRYLAVAVGRVLEVWCTPSLQKVWSAMELHRRYGQCHSTITSLAWSADSRWLAVGSTDLTARVFSLDPVSGFSPPVLAGHRDRLAGVFFTTAANRQAARVCGKPPPVLYTVSRDGALFGWGVPDGFNDDGGGEGEALPLATATWQLLEKHYFNRPQTQVTAVDWHAGSGMLVVGYSTGLFDLLQLPEAALLHSLSISQQRVTSAVFNAAGDWIAIGCAAQGQLLVWEWRSETYVLKQQGHYYDVSCVDYSPDGALMASGADDAKVKVWTAPGGFCFVTFTEHTAPVTCVRFAPSGGVLLSASLDGTVRAFDLVRYRNFRTFTSPTPCQFGSLAVDGSGEVVCAGAVDTFQVFVWSMKTGRLLDVLSAHEGPVAEMAFCAALPLLATCSWDRTVRTWDVFGGGGGLETLQHNHDVLAVAFRPDGKQLAAATLNGDVYFWDPHEGELQGVLEGRRDIRGGRLQSDRRAAGNLSSGACFTSLTYTADGTMLVAAGRSKYVCVYDVAERIMLRRFAVSNNKSLDGVLDQLNSKHVTDAGPLALIDDEAPEDDVGLITAGGGPSKMPGTGSAKQAVAAVRSLALAPSGRSWAAATTEGVAVFTLDHAAGFDPTDLDVDITPQAARECSDAGQSLMAVLIAVRLNDQQLLEHVLMCTPRQEIGSVASRLPETAVQPVMLCLATCLEAHPHVEFTLEWIKAVCVDHARLLGQPSLAATTMPTFRSLQKSLTSMHTSLSGACESNIYTLEYLQAVGAAKARAAQVESDQMESDAYQES